MKPIPESNDRSDSPGASRGAGLSREVLEAIWDISPLGMQIMRPGDSATPIVLEDCNPTICRMHGYKREELVGRSIDLLQAVPWTQTIGRGWFESLKKNPLSGQSLHRKKDGSTFMIAYTVTYFEENGEVCPANWKPGSDTLTPGLDLVGKI